MNRTWLLIALGFATLLVGGPGYAGSDPATTQGTLAGPGGTLLRPTRRSFCRSGPCP